MSTEIAPALDGISEVILATSDPGNEKKDLIDDVVLPLDWFRFRENRNPLQEADLIGGNHQTRHFLPPEKGHKHITQSNPTPQSFNPLLVKIKEPSVLLLRGCDQLLLSSAGFSLDKFKTLTCLEISGVSHLTALPEQVISEMNQLQTLNLSHLGIQHLPDDLFCQLTNLRSLVLSGFSDLHSLPKFPEMTALECLDLSHLLIQSLPEGCISNLRELRWLILRGCSKLRYLPSTRPLRLLEVLDLSHCTALEEAESMDFVHPKLKLLDLSFSALPCPPRLNCQELTHLFLRGVKMDKVDSVYDGMLKLLAGAQNVNVLDRLRGGSDGLVTLDLSRTEIESIPLISTLVHLRSLLLSECTMLARLAPMERLTELEVLDISGCEILGDLPGDLCNLKALKELNLSGCSLLAELREGLFDQMSCLEKLDISKTSINHLPSLANLTNLRTLNISQTSVEEVPDSSNLASLRDFLFDGCQKLKGVPACLETVANRDPTPPGRGEISKPNEVQLVSTFFGITGFDLFRKGFDGLVGLISSIQEEDLNATKVASLNIRCQTLKSHSKRILADLKYILDNVDHLERSESCTSAEELLDELMTAYPLSAFDFPPDSTNLNGLFRAVAKLKLLVPPKQLGDLEKKKNHQKGKKKKEFTRRIRDGDKSDLESNIVNIDSLFTRQFNEAYDTLTDTQRNCLLYFSAFPTHESLLSIKQRILIQLWYGEGFIEPQQQSLQSIPIQNSDIDPAEDEDADADSDSSSESMHMSMGQYFLQGYRSKEVDIPSCVEQIGRNILTVLNEKGFIDLLGSSDDKKIYWSMVDNAISFVKARAMKEGLFDFDHTNDKLTPHLNGSGRACLMKAKGRLPSSNKLWESYSNSSGKLQRLKCARTLFNADETLIDIRGQWFSKMTNLCVLHLGRWDYSRMERTEVADLRFLEELKNMRQLRLMSLEGLSAIKKLPDSICKLTNLKVLNLRDCSDLEDLPVGIGSLKNLTHLDLTGCHVLSKLPKGIRLLSKLEVLKGFVITYQIGGRQHINACTLGELLKLERLRILKLVVNRDAFPDSKDLGVFREMKNLYNLKITWETDYNKDLASQAVVENKASRPSRFQQLKCWDQQTHQKHAEELSRSSHLSNLRKLALCCFPLENAPNWLDPTELGNLEKLSIMGGELRSLARDTDQSAWNVTSLCLGHLKNMDMEWKELRHIFSKMIVFEQLNCVIQNAPPSRMWTIK